MAAFLLRKPISIVRLSNLEFGVLHTGNKFWKITDFEFKEKFQRIFFNFKLQSHTEIDIEVSVSMINNVCIAIPFESLYVILDMEWKELDSNLRFIYGCK